MKHKLFLTDKEMHAIGGICKQYFDACTIGKVRPPEDKTIAIVSVLEKFKKALDKGIAEPTLELVVEGAK